MTKRRVVVTGMGIISPVGNTLKQAWDNIVNGVSGIAPITHFDSTDFSTKIAGEIKNFTGIDDPYEEPLAPELTLLAAEKTPDILAGEIISYLMDKGIISSPLHAVKQG